MKYDIVKNGEVVGETEIKDEVLLSLKEFKQGLHNLHKDMFGSYQGTLNFETSKNGVILVFSTKGEFLLALKPQPQQAWYRRIV